MVAVVLIALCWHNADAIGAWVGGKVTRAPWSEEGHFYIQIGEVRYTIMPDTRVVFAYTANSATLKDPIKLSALRNGDSLLAQAEGNRIYQIEKQQ